jgi:type VI secretion system secreted protein VgrG
MASGHARLLSRRSLTRFGLTVGAASAVVLAVAPAAFAAQGPVGLGTAGSFAVLAGSGITNTGPTTITGDIGTYRTPSETGMTSVSLTGTNHDADAVTRGAKNDLRSAYDDAAGRNPVTNVPVELGGTTLLSGVYTSPTLGLTGTLTLDAKGQPNAVFIFQAGSTLITASNSAVRLINGAQACNVVWQVGSSATFGTATEFVGDVLSHTSITAQTSATFQGRLLASNGAVTLDTNTITASACSAVVSPSPTATGSGTSSGSPTPARTPTSSPAGSAGHSPTPSATASGSGRAGSGSGSGGAGTGNGSGQSTGSADSVTSPLLPNTGLPAIPVAALGFAFLIIGAAISRGARQSHIAPRHRA